jgi:hypothetical protein
MRLQRAVITDHDTPFMVVAVPKPVIDDRAMAERTVRFLQQRWANLPIALVTRDDQGAPNAYYGRDDLVMPLLRIPPAELPWSDVPIR